MIDHDDGAVTMRRDDDGHLIGVGDIDLADGSVEDTAELVDLIPIYGRSVEDADDLLRLVIAVQQRWLKFVAEVGEGAFRRGLASTGTTPLRTHVLRDEHGAAIGAVQVPISPEEAKRLGGE